jgi:hypothetical protein
MVKKKTSAKCGKVLRRQREGKSRIRILCSSKDSTGSEHQARDRSGMAKDPSAKAKINKEREKSCPTSKTDLEGPS